MTPPYGLTIVGVPDAELDDADFARRAQTRDSAAERFKPWLDLADEATQALRDGQPDWDLLAWWLYDDQLDDERAQYRAEYYDAARAEAESYGMHLPRDQRSAAQIKACHARAATRVHSNAQLSRWTGLYGQPEQHDNDVSPRQLVGRLAKRADWTKLRNVHGGAQAEYRAWLARWIESYGASVAPRLAAQAKRETAPARRAASIKAKHATKTPAERKAATEPARKTPKWTGRARTDGERQSASDRHAAVYGPKGTPWDDLTPEQASAWISRNEKARRSKACAPMTQPEYRAWAKSKGIWHKEW